MTNTQILSEQTPYDVIISGGGPVGLFLACELALAQCTVLVLEKAADPHSPLKRFPFGIRGLSSPSIESLHRRGLLDQFEVHKSIKTPHAQLKGQTPQSRAVGHFAGISLFDKNVDATQWKYRLPSSTPPSLVSEMQEVESILAQRAASLGVIIQRGLSVSGFQQTADSVTVQTGDQSFTARWLVGCDGARSVVRKLGGFDFAGTDPEFTGYSTRIDLADPGLLLPGRNLTPSGMYLQSQPGYVLIQDFDGGAFHRSEQPITLEHLQAVLRRVSGTSVTITAVHNATTWTDHARQATSYRNGHVLLAGDAAHIHSPLGGQGLNLGLGDAMNLGWKLAATIHGRAPEGLLDSYFAERYPLGAQVLDWSRAQVAIMNPAPAARALNAIFRDLIDTQDGATYFAGRVWGVNTHYELGGGHPLTGYSLPNYALEDGVTVGELMRDGHGLLLDFDGDTALRSLAQEYGVRYVTGSAEDQLGVTAALVRPDGIIAWAADGVPDMDALRVAADRWFTAEK